MPRNNDWHAEAAQRYNKTLSLKNLAPLRTIVRSTPVKFFVVKRSRIHNREEDSGEDVAQKYDKYPIEEIHMVGSKGNIYLITMAEYPTCTCEDAYFRHAICKHLCFAFRHIYKLREYPNDLTQQRLIEIFEKNPIPGYSSERKQIDGPCGICYEQLSKEETRVVWCRARCGNNLHESCFAEFKEFNIKNGLPTTCPFCRSPWVDATLANVKISYPPGNGGYGRAELVLESARETTGQSLAIASASRSLRIREDGGSASRAATATANHVPGVQRASAAVPEALRRNRALHPVVSTQAPSPTSSIRSNDAQEAQRAHDALTIGRYFPSMDIGAGADSVEEALGRIGFAPGSPQLTCEAKYDGWRTQIHVAASPKIFSHGGSELTVAYPDIIRQLTMWRKEETDSAVLDCELVAWDVRGKCPLPRSMITQRGRSPVQEQDVTIQVCVFAFDILSLNGRTLIHKPLRERRQELYRSFREIDNKFHFPFSTNNPALFEQHFMQSVEKFREGVVIKKLDSNYQTGARSANWVKVKKYHSLDLVVIGAKTGERGKRQMYTSFLLACYDDEERRYEAIGKITGLRTRTLSELYEKLHPLRLDGPDPSYVPPKKRATQPDTWFQPGVVLEVTTQKLNWSHDYQAACTLQNSTGAPRGVSLEAVKFVEIRSDKNATQATSSKQIAKQAVR